MTFTAYVVGQGTLTGSLKVAQISRTPLQPERDQIATTIEIGNAIHIGSTQSQLGLPARMLVWPSVSF